jgi:hypothetical protein
MKKIRLLAALAGAAVFVTYNCTNNKPAPASSGIYNQFCPTSPDGGPCPQLPYEVNEKFVPGYTSTLDSAHQIPFDVFSWQTFIALNWPSDGNGKPAGNTVTDAPYAPRVWEYYADPAEVFNNNPSLMQLLAEAKKNGQKFFYMDSKAPVPLIDGKMVDMELLNNSHLLKGFKQADGYPLIDRNLNFALFEIKMNPVETKYTLDNHLTTKQGIYTYATANGGMLNLPASDSAQKNDGSLEIKASWRILVPALGDDTSRFFCRKATIYIDSAHTRNHRPLILKNIQVGLVGMHIVRKTSQTAQKQIWTTFEHIDNVPDNPQQAEMENRRWSFYNPGCFNCVPNTPPVLLPGDNKQYLWDTAMPYAASYGVTPPSQSGSTKYGTQAIRVYPVYKYTEMVNQLWQAQLKGSVWANYRLVGTQWQRGDVKAGTPLPMAPNFLANTTMETFMQDSSSCISCHNHASVKFNNDTIPTDLSFIFGQYAKDSAAGR